jgi:hypothetical protein
MENSSSKIDSFLSLFKEFELQVTLRDGYTKPNYEREAIEIQRQNSQIKKDLEKALRKIQEEYAVARKMFKAGKIGKEDLVDFEWRIYELKEQIDRLNHGEV